LLMRRRLWIIASSKRRHEFPDRRALPPGLCRWLEARGYGAAHVIDVMVGEAPDRDVAAYAVANVLVLVTKDDAFLTRYPPVDYQLVWVRIGNATNRALAAWLEARWDGVVAALEAGEQLVEVR
jgi:predicted nuclease of predicted toxin-antitoxin system